MRLLLVLSSVVPMVLAGCALPAPSASVPEVVGTVRVAVVRAVEDNQLFGAVPRARLLTTNGRPPMEWGLALDAVTARDAPVGSYTLSAFAVYLSDTIVCVDQANGAPGQTCLQPTLGTSLTCNLLVVVNDAVPLEATFQMLANGRCRLELGLPGAPVDGSPSAAALPSVP